MLEVQGAVHRFEGGDAIEGAGGESAFVLCLQLPGEAAQQALEGAGFGGDAKLGFESGAQVVVVEAAKRCEGVGDAGECEVGGAYGIGGGAALPS